MGDRPDLIQYVTEPFDRILAEHLEETLELSRVTRYALKETIEIPRLQRVLGKPQDAIERSEAIGKIARREVEAGFPTLGASAAIVCWGALEAAIRDTLARWLETYPAYRVIEPIGRIKLRLLDYERLGDDRWAYVVDCLENEISEPVTPGVARFDRLLKVFGACPEIEAIDRRNLMELACIRNVLVHRAGLADRRFITLCPWMEVAEGDRLRVSEDMLMKYISSIATYGAEALEKIGSVLRAHG